MSAPISHIVFTEKVFDKYFSKFDHKEFILGTSFPDIRYLANLDRNLTHFENVKIQEILNSPNSFEAGVLFHSFIDGKRIEYINNNIKFKKSDITPITVFAIKCLEDQQVYNLINHWNKLSNYFIEITEISSKYNVSKQIVNIWFNMINKYISKFPNTKQCILFARQLKKDKDFCEELKKEIEILKDVTNNAKYILDFYEKFMD